MFTTAFGCAVQGASSTRVRDSGRFAISSEDQRSEGRRGRQERVVTRFGVASRRERAPRPGPRHDTMNDEVPRRLREPCARWGSRSAAASQPDLRHLLTFKRAPMRFDHLAIRQSV